MKIDVLTLFPEMFTGVFSSSILGKAHAKQLVQLRTVNFRDFAMNKHHTVDDTPYGGGGGMVLKPEPIFAAVESLMSHENAQTTRPPRVILMCPQGKPFSQMQAVNWAAEDHLIFICGHYEGFDERIREHLVTDECSIGDYVLTGGELPAMVVIDSIVRLLPGVLGNDSSALQDSFRSGLLEHPQYTRPPEFREWQVPDVLLSGNHERIQEWREQQALFRTLQRRPDLLHTLTLTERQKKWLAQFILAQNQQ